MSPSRSNDPVQTAAESAEGKVFVHIQTGPIDVAAEYAALGEPGAGGRVVFTGCVRPEEGERVIDRLDYEHYEGMAEKELRRIAAEAVERWGLLSARVVHRVGPIAVGEESVVISVGAGHRAEAFEAARFIIDELKKRAPIWKSAPVD